MFQWQLWSPWQQADLQATTQIAFGDGLQIRAVDLVDGHSQDFQRGKTNHGQHGSERNLTKAVHVIAPQLAPLTDLAQNIADNSMKAQPKNKFRKDLQHALETTHRQQSVRRTLGIQPPAPKARKWQQSHWLALIIAVVLVMVGIGIARRQTRKSECL